MENRREPLFESNSFLLVSKIPEVFPFALPPLSLLSCILYIVRNSSMGKMITMAFKEPSQLFKVTIYKGLNHLICLISNRTSFTGPSGGYVLHL